MPRRRRRVTLTPAESGRFEWLFEALKSVDPDKRPDLDTLLERQKAKSVSLEDLANALFAERCPTNFVRVREELQAFLEDVRQLREAMRRVERYGVYLDARRLGVRPPVFGELLRVMGVAIDEAAGTAGRMHALLGSRVGKTKPSRASIPVPRGVGRDDWRELRRAVRLVAPHVQHGSVSIQYGAPPRCSRCGNPAPLLFRREK